MQDAESEPPEKVSLMLQLVRMQKVEKQKKVEMQIWANQESIFSFRLRLGFIILSINPDHQSNAIKSIRCVPATSISNHELPVAQQVDSSGCLWFDGCPVALEARGLSHCSGETKTKTVFVIPITGLVESSEKA